MSSSAALAIVPTDSIEAEPLSTEFAQASPMTLVGPGRPVEIVPMQQQQQQQDHWPAHLKDPRYLEILRRQQQM